MRQDLRFALRQLMRSPGFTLLALGAAASDLTRMVLGSGAELAAER